ncbi:hypothetical protein MMC19_003278 [Ptychographa xylographoides]|nr:hypothetical protein [Ptychographa xylographoides]
MAENIPPGGQAANVDATRGVPYYEKLKRDLRETLQKKRLLDKNMASLEEQIYRFEATYLEETSAGNIIKGFDNYIKGSSATGTISGTTGGGTATRRKGTIMEHDRVFSRSSIGFMRETSPSSTQTTPSHAPTPTSSYAPPGSARESNHPTPTSAGGMKSNTKKNKKGVEKDEDESEGKPPKRLKITYARGEKGGSD